MPRSPKPKTPKDHAAKAVDPAAICSPLEVFKSLSAKKQDDLVSDIIMTRAQRGDVMAARYLRNHPRLRVMAFWVHGFRLNEDEEKERGGRLQCVQMDFSIGLCRADDPSEWESEFLHFDVQIDADENNRIRWRNWGQLCDSGPHDKLLPVFLGDWIKQPRQLKPQKPGARSMMIDKNTEMKLGRFIDRLQRWKYWENDADQATASGGR